MTSIRSRVASDSTAFRVIDRIEPALLEALRAAHATARELLEAPWRARAAPLPARGKLHLQGTWPWADELVAAFRRLKRSQPPRADRGRPPTPRTPQPPIISTRRQQRAHPTSIACPVPPTARPTAHHTPGAAHKPPWTTVNE